MNFIGKSIALSPGGLADVASQVGVGLAEVLAILSVETHGAGFLADRRPQILFERHIFSKLTVGQYDGSHPGISSPTQGGYGAGGAHQYDRLSEALSLDENAALQSASWLYVVLNISALMLCSQLCCVPAVRVRLHWVCGF